MAPLIDNETYDCVECDAKFQTYRELERHKATLMREGDGHIHCKICGTFFRIQYSLTEHIKQYHAHKQDLKCPGCDQPFTRIASLVDHVENDKCPKINVQEVRDERLRKALLGKKLGVQHSFGDFLIPHEQLATVEPIRHQHDDKDLLTYGEDVASEMALSVKESEVEPVEEPVPPQNPLPPHLRKDVKADHWLKRRAEMALSQSDRDGNTTDVEHGDDEELSDASDEDGYDWKALASRIKFLGPESSVFSSPAKSVIDSGESVGDELSVAKGTAESLDIAYSYKGKSQPEGVLSNVDPNLAANTAAINVSDPWEQWNADQKDLLARFDPDSPSFDPKLFYLEHVNEYLCSKCSDRFPSVTYLVQHLRSPTAHQPKQKAQCPSCTKVFKSIPALMAHCESESRRCWIRNTDSYRPFLDQLTGGIADLAGQYGDKTNKYVVTREAIKKYGNKDSGEDIIRRDILHLETRMKQPRTVTGDGMW